MPLIRRRRRQRASRPAMSGGLVAAETSLRVLFADERARQRLGGGVVEVMPAALSGRVKDRKHPPRIDVVVVSAERLRDIKVQRLIQTAGPAAVVSTGGGLPSSMARQPVSIRAPLAVNMSEFNPVGFRRNATDGPLLAHFEGDQPPPALIDVVRDRWGADSLNLDVIEAAGTPESIMNRYDARGVIEHPDLHEDGRSQAEWILTCVAQGIPVIGQLADEAADLLDEDIVKAVDSAAPPDLTDTWRRDELSARQRRAALRHHGAPHVWRRIADDIGLETGTAPSVSVILASNRPQDVVEAAQRFSTFRYPRKELVVGLHGEGFPSAIEGHLRAEVGSEAKVVQVSSQATLGEVLNHLTQAASGDLVAKMDDDDLYDPHHLDDLVDALRYSGATLVGKGSEFVYLGEIDTTIRRLPNGVESRSRSIGGGTLMIERNALRSIGGWQRAPRAVDQRLMDDVIAGGGQIHRTHGYGFVLMRRYDGHTWDSGVDYFLRSAVQQWHGLATSAAGFG